MPYACHFKLHHGTGTPARAWLSSRPDSEVETLKSQAELRTAANLVAAPFVGFLDYADTRSGCADCTGWTLQVVQRMRDRHIRFIPE